MLFWQAMSLNTRRIHARGMAGRAEKTVFDNKIPKALTALQRQASKLSMLALLAPLAPIQLLF